MAVTLTDGSAGLFDVLGRMFQAMASMQTSAGTTVRTDCLDILTQFENVDDSLALNAIIADVTTVADTFDSGAQSAMQSLKTIAQDYLLTVFHEDAPFANPSVDNALLRLIAQMEADSDSVDASTVSIAVAAGGSNVGNAVLVATVKRGDGLSQMHALAEVLTATALTDDGTTLSLSDGESVGVTSVRWPQGSGASQSLRAVTPRDGLIREGSFDVLSTVDSDLPSGWLVTTGTPGTTLYMTTPEQQTITIGNTPSGGYYSLRWTNAAGDVQETGQLLYNATAGQVQSALRRLTGLESVTVTSSGTAPNLTHTVTFLGIGGDVAQISSVNNTTGTNSTNEVQTITISDADGGTFTLTFGGQTTSAIAWNAAASVVDTALEALSTIEVGEVSVSGSAGGPYAVTFLNSLGASDQPLMTASAASLTNTAASLTIVQTTAGAAGTNEVQTLSFDAAPTSGTFTISFDGQTTGNIAYNASAATIETAIEALSNVGTGNATCAGGPIHSTPVTVTFTGDLQYTNVSLLTADVSSVGGSPVDLEIVQLVAGDPGTDEVQVLTMYGTPTGGTFTLSFDGQTTGAIAYNASAATVETAIEALSNIGEGDVAVTGSALPGNQQTITFGGALAATNVPELTADVSNLTGGSISASVAETTPGVTGLPDPSEFWKLDESSGVRYASVGTADLTESASIGNAGGKVNSAAAFSGSSYLYQNPISSNVQPSTSFVTWAWVYFTNTPSGTVASTLRTVSLGGGVTYSYGYEIDISGSAFRLRVGIGSTSPGIVAITDAASLSTFTWYFVAAGYDSATNKLRISVNGAAWSESTPAATPALTPTNETGKFSIGAKASSVGSGINGGIQGRIDEVSFFKQSLTSADISRGYNSGSGHTYPFPSGTNEIQTITLAGTPAAGSFTLTYAGQTTGAIAYNASAATVETALKALSNIGSSDVSCAGGDLPGTPVTVTFTGTLANTDVALMTVDDSRLKYGIATTANGSPATNEVQRISTDFTPTGGTFTLTYDGQTTSAIAFDATAAAVDAALEALSSIGSGDVVVTGGPLTTGPFSVTFQGSLAATDVDLMTSASSLIRTPPLLTSVETTAGVAGTNEVQTVTLTNTPTGGTFTLTYGGQTTSGIAYNASAATVETALESLSSIDSVSVTGSSGGPWAVQFQGSLAATNIALMTGDGSSLTNASPSISIVETAKGSSGGGTITHATTIPGTPQVYSGSYALVLESDGSEQTTLHYRLGTLEAETNYAMNAFLTAAAGIASGTLTIDLLDGIDGTVLTDEQGANQTLTVDLTDLTTSWQSLDDLMTEVVLRTPRKLPPFVYLRIRWGTVPPDGATVFIDELTMIRMTELYAGGPFVAMFVGNTALRIDDVYTLTVANNRAGTLHEWMNRTFDLADKRLLLPVDAAGSETIPDSLIQ